MGLMDFIKGELIEIIEWTDDSRDTLSYRFPDQDKEIKRGAQLIVMPETAPAVKMPEPITSSHVSRKSAPNETISLAARKSSRGQATPYVCRFAATTA